MTELPSASDKIICPECNNDTFRIYSKKLGSRMFASEERSVVCSECGYSESLYKIGDKDERLPVPRDIYGRPIVGEVYVVLKEMDYAVYWIRGVFSSESLAETFIEEKKQDEGAWNDDVEGVWRTEEWKVDKNLPERLSLYSTKAKGEG